MLNPASSGSGTDIPTSLPPSGNAGGDLTGTYPNPTLAAVSRTNNTSTASPSAGGTFTAIDAVTTDTKGRVTAVNTKTVTLPASGGNATEVGGKPWVSGTSYVVGDIVSYDNKIYICTTANSGTSNPTSSTGQTRFREIAEGGGGVDLNGYVQKTKSLGSGVNWNDVVESGFYTLTGGTNAPTSGSNYWNLAVFGSGEGTNRSVIQMASYYSVIVGAVYVRSGLRATGSWTWPSSGWTNITRSSYSPPGTYSNLLKGNGEATNDFDPGFIRFNGNDFTSVSGMLQGNFSLQTRILTIGIL